MTALVIDASALVAVLIGREQAAAVGGAMAAAGDLAAPELVDVEVTSVIRRTLLAGRMGAARADRALQDLIDAPLTRYRHEPLLPRIWGLRDNLTAYDAAYVALAELLDAPLLTADASLAASPGHTARIELV